LQDGQFLPLPGKLLLFRGKVTNDFRVHTGLSKLVGFSLPPKGQAPRRSGAAQACAALVLRWHCSAYATFDQDCMTTLEGWQMTYASVLDGNYES
jgi:hypothetical protein